MDHLSSVSVAKQIEWHGTTRESDDLVTALNRYCTCQYTEDTGALVSRCAGHKMMVEDQRALDWLLFCRRNVEILRGEEGVPDANPR